MEIKNLNQLKKALTVGAHFHIISHFSPECVGQVRKVASVNTQGIYTIVPDDPDANENFANNCKGSYLAWDEASDWDFTDGVCSRCKRGTARSEGDFYFSFKIIE